ncbi:hypothetical protein MMC11_004561 [Xylographa trunciseda]|nr:hypothetical protein [Xylographa trunciseda]
MSDELDQQVDGPPAQEYLEAVAEQDVDSDEAPSTPVTVKAISPILGGSPSSLDLDKTHSGGKTDEGVQTERDGLPKFSSDQVDEAQGDEDDEISQSKEGDDIVHSTKDGDVEDSEAIQSKDGDDIVHSTDDGETIHSTEDNDDELGYTQPPVIATPKTHFSEYFFAPQGDRTMIPPVFGAALQYPERSDMNSRLATTQPQPVPHHIFQHVITSGRAEMPLGPGMEGIYPSARDLVATVMAKQVVPMEDMAERLRDQQKTSEERKFTIEELEKTLDNPDAAAQSTEIGVLKATNRRLEDQLEHLTYDYGREQEIIESESRRLQAEIAEKDETIARLRAVSGSAPEGTIVSPTNESGFTTRPKSNKLLHQVIADLEARVTELQNEVIYYRTKDMTKTESDLTERTLRAEYALKGLEESKKLHDMEMDEQLATIARYEERIRDLETQIQTLQLAQAQHTQDMRAAEKTIAEFTNRELTLIQEKTSFSDRLKVLNDELKDRSKELKESDEQLSIVRKENVLTFTESARLKNEIQKIGHEQTKLKKDLALAGEWKQEKYTKDLASEELKQQLAALKEDKDRMSDTHRIQIENIEIATREKIKQERKEAKQKRRKVQEEFIALRGRALTDPSGTESEQEPDGASAVNLGISLEEELLGSSESPGSSPIEGTANVASNGGSNTQASPTGTQEQSPHKNPPQWEEYTASLAEDEIPIRADRTRGRHALAIASHLLTDDIDTSRGEEQNTDGEVQLDDKSKIPSQNIISTSDNEAEQELDAELLRQRPPIAGTTPNPEEDSKISQQRDPTINEQFLQEGRPRSRRLRPLKLDDQVPSVSEMEIPSGEQRRPLTAPGVIHGIDWAGSRRRRSGAFGSQSSPLIRSPITASSFEPQQRPGRTATGVEANAEANRLQEREEVVDGSGPPVPPSNQAGTEAHPPQELGQAGDGTPSSPSSGPPSPPLGGGGLGGGRPGERPRVPIIIPVYQRVPYRQGTRFGDWEGLIWAMILLFVIATFLMFMALREERNRWLAANEGTRQMLFSMKRRGPVGTGLLTWIFDNAFLNVETNSYG